MEKREITAAEALNEFFFGLDNVPKAASFDKVDFAGFDDSFANFFSKENVSHSMASNPGQLQEENVRLMAVLQQPENGFSGLFNRTAPRPEVEDAPAAEVAIAKTKVPTRTL